MDRFYTGHELFDEIFTINYGSSILILDENFKEGIDLLKAIFKKKKPFELVSYEVKTSGGQVLKIGDLSLSDASVNINKLREDFKGSVIIHNYLPDFLIKYETDAFLRMLEGWRDRIKSNKTVEFYILPKGAFLEVEKKIMSIVDGVIEIKVKREGKGFGLSFIVMRCCDPEYHLHEFRYKIEGSNLLIEWEGEYRDRLPIITFDEIMSRVESYKRDIQFLRVERGATLPTSLPVYDYWLLSQIEGKDMFYIKILFYERFDEILEKIAKWHILGYIRVVKKAEKLIDERKFNIGKPISWKTKIALNLPLGFTKWFLSRDRIRAVPVDVYSAEKRAIFEFLKIFFGESTELGIESLDNLLSLEEGFHEVVGRSTAAERIRKLGEDVTKSIDIKYLPKIVKTTLYIGYKLDCNVKEVSPDLFLVTVYDCFLCEGVRSIRPICRSINGALVGACSITFKKMVSCKEIKCKALGDENCVFELKIEK
ncbi:MAG: V4R domain-containing protein [Nitrososphaerales archaeon]